MLKSHSVSAGAIFVETIGAIALSPRKKATKTEHYRHQIMIPIELYHIIASESLEAYRALLALPPFARDIDVSKRLDYMILFEYSIYIDKYCVIWLRKFQKHRTDGPAVECADGSREWRVGGILHRTNGPAIIQVGHRCEWWVHGLRHRVDGPAIECEDGFRSWWVNGQRHRPDGPAVEYAEGHREWWINGSIIKNGACFCVCGANKITTQS